MDADWLTGTSGPPTDPDPPERHGIESANPPGRRRPDFWSIGLYRGPTPLMLSPSEEVANPILCAADVTDLTAEFVADPFLVPHAGHWFLFFEVVPQGSRDGVIGLAESADGRNWRYQSIVLRERFHLSYPHIISWQGEYYMTPETLGANKVRLYRAAQFPHRWELACDLIPGQHADPTLVRVGETWWLFTCSAPYRHSELRLYFAGELNGPWTEHPRSPIVLDDPRCARPAGQIVSWDGALLRFAQDCVPYYGYQVRAFRITRLTREDYQEEIAGPDPVIAPGLEPWSKRGMHHVDAHQCPSGGWIAAVDGF